MYKEPVLTKKTPPEKTTRRKRRRGKHYEDLLAARHSPGDYPNEAFRKHNEIKMLAALKSSVSPDELDLLPAALHKLKEDRTKEKEKWREERVTRNLDRPYTNYGRGVYNCKKQQLGIVTGKQI